MHALLSFLTRIGNCYNMNTIFRVVLSDTWPLAFLAEESAARISQLLAQARATTWTANGPGLPSVLVGRAPYPEARLLARAKRCPVHGCTERAVEDLCSRRAKCRTMRKYRDVR